MAAQKTHMSRPVTYSGTICVIHQPTAHTVIPRAFMVCGDKPSGGVIKAIQIPKGMKRNEKA